MPITPAFQLSPCSTMQRRSVRSTSLSISHADENMAPSSAFLFWFSSSSFFARDAAFSASVSISRLTAIPASSILLAAFSLGAILKPKPAASISASLVCDTAHIAFIPSWHLPSRTAFTASAANTLFSPVSGTMSATVAIPANGIYLIAFSLPISASASFWASPAPHICRFGYSSALLHSTSASHLGSESPGIWWSVTITRMPSS